MGYTEATLKKKSVAELKELAEDLFDEDELEAITTKQPLIDKLLESDTDEVEDDEDELDDDEASDEVDDSDDEVDDEEDDLEVPEADEVDEIDEVEEKPKAKPAKKTKYTDGGKNEAGEKLLGAKEVAAQIGTDAKTLRQFFRSGKSSFGAVGAGGRYEFSEADLPKIKSEFEGWKANKPGRGRATDGESTSKKRRSGKAAPKPEDTIDEVEEVEDLDDLDDIELD